MKDRLNGILTVITTLFFVSRRPVNISRLVSTFVLNGVIKNCSYQDRWYGDYWRNRDVVLIPKVLGSFKNIILTRDVKNGYNFWIPECDMKIGNRLILAFCGLLICCRRDFSLAMLRGKYRNYGHMYHREGISTVPYLYWWEGQSIDIISLQDFHERFDLTYYIGWIGKPLNIETVASPSYGVSSHYVAEYFKLRNYSLLPEMRFKDIQLNYSENGLVLVLLSISNEINDSILKHVYEHYYQQRKLVLEHPSNKDLELTLHNYETSSETLANISHSISYCITYEGTSVINLLNGDVPLEILSLNNTNSLNSAKVKYFESISNNSDV